MGKWASLLSDLERIIDRDSACVKQCARMQQTLRELRIENPNNVPLRELENFADRMVTKKKAHLDGLNSLMIRINTFDSTKR